MAGSGHRKQRRTGAHVFLSVVMMFTLVFGGAPGFLPAELTNRVFAAVQAEYYVSTSGSDANPGTVEQPFLTIGKAREVIREAKGTMTGDIVVYIRGGRYNEQSTIAFNEADSGNSGYSIIYRNFPHEEPVFVGGRRITDWTPDSGGVYKSHVGTGWKFNTMMENNVRSVKARFPNTGFLTVGASVSGSEKTKFVYQSGDLPNGFDIADAQAYVWVEGNWRQSTVPITGVNSGTRVVTLAAQTAGNIVPGSRYFIKGSKSFLDAPGEFYLDETAGDLYYRPRQTPIGNQVIEAPTTKRLIELKGSSPNATLHHLRFEGLTFTLSEFTNSLPNEDSSTLEGLVYLENADHITLKFNKLLNAGFNGIELNKYAQYNTIYGNWIQHSGLHGIKFSGYATGEGPNGGSSTFGEAYVNKFNTVSNNLIENGGDLVGHSAGIYMGNTGDNEVSYNQVRHYPYSGIELDGSSYFAFPIGGTLYGQSVTFANHWDFAFARNNTIKFNDVSDVLWEGSDGGMIYTWGTGKGNVIDNNRIHDAVGGVKGAIAGVYLDDSSSYVTVKNNIIVRNQGYAVDGSFYPFLIKGIDHVITNNIVADNLYAPKDVIVTKHCCTNQEQTQGLEFTKNILYTANGTHIGRIVPELDTNLPQMAEWDYNTYYHPNGAYNMENIPGDDTYNTWKSLFSNRFDQHSSTADPQFVDAANDNYNVATGSPALAKGFVNIDRINIGLKDDFPFDDPGPTPSTSTYAIADTYAWDGSLNTNYGSDAALQVKLSSAGYNRQSYLKFNMADGFPPQADVGAIVADTANWEAVGSTALNWSNGAMTLSGVQATAWYYGQKYLNEEFAVNLTTDMTVSGAWPSIALRAKDPLTEGPWRNNYMVVLQADRIEIQGNDNAGNTAFNYFVYCDLAGTGTRLVKASAVNTDSGVRLQVKLGDTVVAEYVDTTNLVPNSGYFGLYSWHAPLTVGKAGIVVGQATLRMYGYTGGAGTAVVYGVDDNTWNESTLTWNNAPAMQTTALDQTVLTDTEQYYDFDVTDYVAGKALTNATVSFGLKGFSGEHKSLNFSSRESANKPILIISPTP